METTLASASARQRWISQYFAEYVRTSKFAPYMGRSPMSIIVCKYELQQEKGVAINIPLITRLKGSGVTGSEVLEGNEEELGNYNFPIFIDWRRNGVRIPKSTTYQTEIDLFNAARDMLKEWDAEKLRDDLIYSCLSVLDSPSTIVPINLGLITQDTVDGGYQILSSNFIATSTQQNNWVANNSDRILFGHLRSNNQSNNFLNSLLELAYTTDSLTTDVAELGKRMAKLASPHIRPYKTKDGAEYFVLFTNSRSFRDIKNDDNMVQANREARAREGNGMERNPLFQDGDLIKDGIIYREVEEIPILPGLGDSGDDIGPNFLCGAQAMGVAWGQEPTPRTDNLQDYQFRPGVAIEELLGVDKLFFNGVQHGMVSIFTAASPDA